LTSFEDVPAAFAVTLDGQEMVRFPGAPDAAAFSKDHPGSRVEIVPA
jgi:hypothetical protein